MRASRPVEEVEQDLAEPPDGGFAEAGDSSAAISPSAPSATPTAFQPRSVNWMVHAHLSTLFPPVRPRGAYLEFRALDALPTAQLRTAASLLACLLGQPGSTRAAAEICGGADAAELWDLAAGAGLRHPAIRGRAGRLIELAREVAPALPAGYLPRDASAGFAALATRVAAGQHLCGE